MGRRDHDPRPPIEVVGAAPPEDTLQRVEVGGGDHRGGGKGVLALVAAIVVLAGLAISSGSGDDRTPQAGEADEQQEERNAEDEAEGEPRERDRTTTTRRRRATTTTTAPPPVSVLPGADAWVLLLGGPGRAQLLDLESGLAQELDLGRDVWSAVAVDGGVVVSSANQAAFHPLPHGDAVQLGSAEQVFGAGPDTVWLVNSTRGGAPEAVLVDLAGAVRAGPLGVEHGWIVGASRDSVVATVGGRVYELAADGAVTPLAYGEAMGVSGDWLLLRVCDDRAACAIEMRNLTSGGSVAVPSSSAEAWMYGVNLTLHPQGRHALALLYGPTPVLVWIDLEGAVTQPIEGLAGVSSAAWLPGDLGAVTVQPGQVTRVFQRDGEVVTEVLREIGADQVVVIPR